MLGRVNVFEPVCSCSVAPPCATLSPTIERMTHMSSACFATFGKSSLISMPLWPYLPKLPRRFQQIADAVLRERERPLERQRLAVVRGQPRLGIERVHVRRTAVHEQENDSLRTRGEMRRFRRQRIRH